MKTRIVMAVNNSATNDYRVVKSAEMVVRAGFECHVVGILKPGFEEKEIINGVTYHRVKMVCNFFGFVAGISSRAFLYLKGSAVHAESIDPAKQETLHKHVTISEIIANLKSRLMCLAEQLLKLFEFLKLKRLLPFSIKIILLPVKKNFHPKHSSIGVRYLQGSYLAAFYNKLLILNGDIYHAHELWMLESCSIVSSKLGKKLVYDSHELEVHRNNDWSLRSNQVRCTYEDRYIHSADIVFTVSNGCAKELVKQYGLEEVFLLRNTPLLSKQTKSEQGIRKNLSLAPDSKLLIYTGSVTFNRGIEIVLQALLYLPEYSLVTIGPWNDKVKKELNELALELAVHDRFYMHPKVPPTELISLISTGDIAVIPIQDACLSYRYCMPNKLFEAAFAGLPVVASDLPDMKAFIIDNELGLVFENDNQTSLVEAIQNAEQKRLHEKIKLKKEKFSRKYCFEKESEILIEKYQELVGDSVAAIETAA